MRSRHLVPTLALAAVVFTGCGAASGSGTTSGTATTGSGTVTTSSAGTTTTTGTSSVAAATLAATHEDDADLTWDEASEVAVMLTDGATNGGTGVTVAGDTVTITAPGTYRISGSLANGSLVVDSAADGVVRLVLDGAAVTSSTGPALLVADADEVVVILADGSTNTLADGTSYVTDAATGETDAPNAAIYSTADLTIAGAGSLTVTGNTADGITSKDGLVIVSGTISVRAVDDGIRGKDYLVVRDGSITVTAGGDGLKSDNTDDKTLGYVLVEGGELTLTVETDAVDAAVTALVTGGSLAISAGDDGLHSDARLEITGGTIDIARSYEGLEGTQIVISGGTIDLVAQDDGLNVAGDTGTAAASTGGRGGGMNESAVEGWFVEMSGGTLLIDAGGDGFDSNGSASVTGGTIVINGPEQNGNGALDVNGEFAITNATLVAAGSGGMVETPSASGQAVLDIRFNTTQAAGTVVQVRAGDGTIVATFQSTKAFASVVVSSPALVSGGTYEVYTGGAVSGEGIGGLYPAAGATGELLGSLAAS